MCTENRRFAMLRIFDEIEREEVGHVLHTEAKCELHGVEEVAR